MKISRATGFIFALWFCGATLLSQAADPEISKAASNPEQLIRTSIDKGLEVLKDKGLSQSARREKIRQIMLQAADMDQIASLTLSRYKNKFSPEQLAQFTEVFSRLLFSTYIGHVEKYSGDPVGYAPSKAISETKISVPVRVQTVEGNIPVDFSLMKVGDIWKIYDVRIEGVSLVNNYRSQFSDFLVNKTPDALIRQLQQKVAANERKS